MFHDQFIHRCKRRSAGMLAGAFAFTSFSLIASDVQAHYRPPAGYTKTELVDGSNQPLVADDIGVSAGGELATITGSTLTLYSSWQNGRHVIGTITDAKDWTFMTDLAFIGENKVIFGENFTTNTAWAVDFTDPTKPFATEYGAPNGNILPGIEGVAVLNPTTVLVSGTTAPAFGPGDLYLKKLDLTGNGSVTSVVSNTGTGHVGGDGVTAAGSGVLLDTGTADAFARIYNLSTGDSIQNVDLTPGGGFGAYALAFDPTGDAFVTTGGTITEIAGIDSASPVVSPFGSFSEGDGAFPTGIAFNGNSFLPGNASPSGALIVNGEFTGDGGLFAITNVPEPSTIAALLLSVTAMVGLGRAQRRPVGNAGGVE